jgi:hypothetical protein
MNVNNSLGTHISFVRSVTMDKWDLSLIGGMKTNESVNRELEYHVPDSYPKPNIDALAKERVRYITAKYKDHAFVRSENHRVAKVASLIHTWYTLWTHRSLIVNK